MDKRKVIVDVPQFLLDVFVQFICRPVNSVVNLITIGAGGLRFDFRVSQIRHSVTNGSPLLRSFFGTVSPTARCRCNGPRHSLHALA